MPFEKELKVATQAVRKASLLTKRIQAEVIAHRESSTITKSDNSPVTVGDYSAQAIIINAIKSNFPGDQIVGEESSDGLSDAFVSEILQKIQENDKLFPEEFGHSQVPFTSSEYPLSSIADAKKVINMGDYEGGASGRFWCLDPIDGTKGFLRGDQFAVCLALIVDGVVQLGCIGCPNLKLNKYGGKDLESGNELGYVFRAIRGQGAFYAATASDNWVQVHARNPISSSELVSLEGVEKSHSSHDEQSIIKQRLGITKSQHLDSQVKYCLLALGLGDVYLRLPIKLDYQEKIWDHAAGNVIVHEAGGIHTDSIDGVPLDFGKGRTLLTKGVIASSGPTKLHEDIINISYDVIRSR